MKEPILIKNSNELLNGSIFHVTESVEKNQQKVLFKEWGEPSTEVARFDLHAKEGAQVEYVLFQNHAVSSEAVAKIVLRADRDSHIKFTIIQQGASKSQVEIEAHCDGQGSNIEIRGLQNAKSTQKMSVDFKAYHGAPHTKTDLQVWCVARDQSHSIFNALVSIKPGSHHSEAYQKNKNLLLSPKAVIDTFPKLFIANDDVKAAHGSSTSTLEPEQFIYLQSRGIDREAAELMLTNGFIHQAIDWLSDETMKARLEKDLGIAEEAWV
jgi:Fe-S cluster assembly protein SufD